MAFWGKSKIRSFFKKIKQIVAPRLDDGSYFQFTIQKIIGHELFQSPRKYLENDSWGNNSHDISLIKMNGKWKGVLPWKWPKPSFNHQEVLDLSTMLLNPLNGRKTLKTKEPSSQKWEMRLVPRPHKGSLLRRVLVFYQKVNVKKLSMDYQCSKCVPEM